MPDIPAEITSPAQYSDLTASTMFQWSAGMNALEYRLAIGTTPTGSDVYPLTSQGLNQSATVNIPANGDLIYVRLGTRFASGWVDLTYYYGEPAGSTNNLADLFPPYSRPAGSTSITLRWTAGGAAQEYWVWVGSTAGGSDIYMASQGLARNVTVSIPSQYQSATLYVRMWTKLSGSWQYQDYTITASSSVSLSGSAAGSTVTGAASLIIPALLAAGPAAGSTVTGAASLIIPALLAAGPAAGSTVTGAAVLSLTLALSGNAAGGTAVPGAALWLSLLLGAGPVAGGTVVAPAAMPVRMAPVAVRAAHRPVLVILATTRPEG
jgi:hypothetical protein